METRDALGLSIIGATIIMAIWLLNRWHKAQPPLTEAEKDSDWRDGQW